MPGSYYVQMDSTQLRNLGLTSVLSVLPFNISHNTEGDVVDSREFILESKALVDSPATPTSDLRAEHTDTVKIKLPQALGYSILVNLFDNNPDAANLKAQLIRLFRLPVVIIQREEDFIVVIKGFAGRKDAEMFTKRLDKAGYTESLIIRR